MIVHAQTRNGGHIATAAHEQMDRKPPSSERFVPEPLLDSDQAAAIMQIHPKTLQRLARKGVIRGVHVGKLWRFRATEIERWIEAQLAS